MIDTNEPIEMGATLKPWEQAEQDLNGISAAASIALKPWEQAKQEIRPDYGITQGAGMTTEQRDLIRRSFAENDPLLTIQDEKKRRYIENLCMGDVDGGEARKKKIALANYYSMHHPEAAGFIYENIEGAIKRYEGKEMSVDQAYASVAEMFQPQDYSMNRYEAAAKAGSVGTAKSAVNAITFLSKNLAGFLVGWFEKGFDLKYGDDLEADEKIFSAEGARQVIDEYWKPYKKALADTENFYSEQMRLPEGGWVLNSDGFSDFVENGTVALVNYLPQLAGQLAMTMGTGSVAPLAFVYGVDGYYDIKEDEELGDVSEGKALLYGLGIGLINGALEKITLDVATGKVTEKFAKEGLKKGFLNAFKYLAITTGKEGAEEGIEEFAENLWDIGFGRRGDTEDWTAGRWMKELFQGVPEAGLLGAVTGFGMGTMPMGAMKKLAVENERARQVIESRIGELNKKENLTPEEEADLYWLKLLGDADPEDVRKAAFMLMHQEINNKQNNAETVNGINLKNVSGNLSNYFSNIKDAIRALYRKAFLDRGNNRSFVNYAEVTDEERKMLSELSGADLSGAQFHGLDETGIRHMDRRHGEDENTAGQVPVTENDVLKIPQIVQETKPTYKGKNDVGNHVFQYHWKQGDEFFYLEEYRNGRGKLVGVSLWKKEGTKATPTSTNESDGKFTPEAIRPRTPNNIAQDSEKASENSASTEPGTIQASEAAEEGEAEAAARAERELKMRRELPHNPADTEAEVEKWKKLFPNANIQTTDAWTPEQIRILRQRGVLAPEKAQGRFDPKTNTVILNVSNLRPSEVGFKVLHEVGLHYGIRQAFGDEAANRLFLSVFDAMQDSPFMQRIIDAYKLRTPMLDENGDAIYNPDGTPLFDDMTDAQKAEAAEEFLAFAAETYGVPIDEIYADNRAEIDKWGREHGRDTHDWNEKRRMTREWMAETGFKPERPGWWKQLISQIRVWLAEHGFGHLREADIETIIQDAFKGASRANRTNGTNGEARYSLMDNAEKRDVIIPALQRIVNGSEEEVLTGIRNDLEQYGGTNDITLVWGNKKKGIYHIAYKRGMNTLMHVLDAVADGELTQYVAGNKTVHLVKDGFEAILSLDENGKKKTWLLTGWEIDKPDALGEFYTNSDATQNTPTFSRRDLGAGLKDIITQFQENASENGEKIRHSIPIDTPEFKNWFKNSKVVDEDGKPLVVYHGTDAEFNIFDMDKTRANMDIRGAFFSPWEDDSRGYGKNVRAFYLSIQNPATGGEAYKALNMFKGQNNAGVKARDYLISRGYDGVVNENEEYIAFYPEQIKSVDNVGTFDPNNPDVRYSVSPVYTGSAADYEQPSLHYVGTGEGNQVYGWGLYGSSSEDVGRDYAEADYNRKYGTGVIDYNGKPLGDLTEIYDSAPHKNEYDSRILHIILSVLRQDAYNLYSSTGIPDLKVAAKRVVGFYTDQGYENYHAAALDVLDLVENGSLTYNPVIKNKKNLYKQTFWPNRNQNLIYWEEGFNATQKYQIQKEAKKENIVLPDDMFYYRDFDYNYDKLSELLGSPKAASEFLYRAGIDGVTYIGDSSGVRNYVAFSDQDIRVDDHIRFSITDIDGNEAARAYIDIIKPYVPFDVHDKDGAYYAGILKEKAGVELEPEDAMQIAQEAWHERRKASVKKSWDQAYTYFEQSNPLFQFLVEFAGPDFKVRPAHRFEGEKFTGSFIAPEYVKYSEKREQGERETDWSYNRYNEKRERALKSAKGLHSDEAAAAYVRKFGGDEIEVEQQIIDLLRDLKRTDIRSDYAKFKRENFARDRMEQMEYEAMMEDIFRRELDDKVISILSAGDPVVTPDWVTENRDVYKELYKRLLNKEAPYTPSQKDIETMNSAIVQEGADAATYAKAYKDARAASAREWMEKVSELRRKVIEGKENAMKLQREAAALLKRAGLEGDRSFGARIINLMQYQTEARRQKAFDQLMSDILAAGTAAKQMKVYDRLRERLQQLGRRADVGRKAIGVRDEATQIQIDKIREIAAMSTYEIAARQGELQDAINAAQEHGESSVEYEEKMALLSKYGDLANKTAAELTLALADLNELAVTGKRKIRERLMERQGQDRMRIQESVDLINGGNFATMGDLDELENRRNQEAGTMKATAAFDLFSGFNLWGKLTALNLAGKKNIRDTVFYRMMEQTHECARNQDTLNEKHQDDTLAAIDRIFGTKGSFERAAKLQELRKVQDKTGVMRRYIDPEKKTEFRRMSLDEARELLKDYDSKTAAGERPALKDYEAEAIRHQLLVYDRKLDKKATEYMDSVTEKLLQMAEEEKERGEKTVVLPVPKYTAESELKLSQMQALYQYLMWQQKNTRYKMVFNGWTEENIKQLEGFLTPQTKAFGAWMTEQLEADRADIDPVYERLYMTAFPHVESYFPAVYHHRGQNTRLGNAQGVDLGAAGAGGQAMAFSPGALRQRVFHMSELRNVDALNVFQNHRMIMTHFVTHGEAARELRAVFANKDVKQAIIEQLGAKQYSSLTEDIADFINGGHVQIDKAAALRGLYSAAVRSKMMINITSGIKQTLGGLTYLQDIPLKDFVSGVNYAVSHPKEVWQTLGKTDYFQNRWRSGSNRDLRMLLDRAGKNGQMDVLMEKADTLSSIPLRAGDAGAVLFGGYAVYRYTYQQGIKRGLSEAEAKRRALLEWEMSTERTQQSSQVHMQNKMQKGSTLDRIFTTYLSNQILMWNHYAPRFFKGDWKGGARGMAAAAITSVAMTTANQLFRKGIWVDDWEFWDYFWDYLSDVLNGSGATGVILGRAIEGANAYGRGANVLQSDEMRAARAARNLYGDVTDEEYEKAMKDAIDILTVFGYFYPPITPALSAVREGRKTKNFWQRLFSRDENE